MAPSQISLHQSYETRILYSNVVGLQWKRNAKLKITEQKTHFYKKKKK